MRSALLLLLTLLAACDDFTQISASGFGAFEPAIAVFGDRVAVAWNDNRHGNDEIYLRLLDRNLRAVTPELRLTDSPAASYEATLVVLDGNLAIAWYDKDAEGMLQVMLGLWSPAGLALWRQPVSAPERNGRVPVLQSVGDRLFIAWIEEPPASGLASAGPSSVMGAWFDAAGKLLQVPFRIADAGRTTWNLNADVLADGSIALVYDTDTDTSASELHLALVSGAESHVTRLGDDDGFASKYPDVAVGPTTSALTWFDAKDGNEEVYLALLDLQAPQHATVADAAIRITNTGGESIGAYLAWNGDTLGLAWNDDEAGQHEIHFQSFAANGQPLIAPRRLTDTGAASMIPAIAPFGRGFVLAWNEVVLGAGGHDGGQSSTRSEIAVRQVDF